MTSHNPVVSPDWLEARLGDPDLAILEISRYQPDEAAYFRGHIPGARYVFWKDFCWDDTERQFPTATEMARRLSALGVGDGTRLVLVGDTIQFATYPYWVLTMTGQERDVFVLDGGHQTWEMEQRPSILDVPPDPIARSRSPGDEDWSSRIGRDEVLAGIGRADRMLLDLRSSEEYRGERVSPTSMAFDHGAERKGRIPGARHLYYERLLSATGTFKQPSDVEVELAAAGVGPDAEIVTYCRLSHRASLGWLVLTRILRRSGVRVYDGSWTEWGSMVGMPIDR